jgi:hypothetical protein
MTGADTALTFVKDAAAAGAESNASKVDVVIENVASNSVTNAPVVTQVIAGTDLAVPKESQKTNWSLIGTVGVGVATGLLILYVTTEEKKGVNYGRA